jgi:peroxiredoxin
VIAVSTDDAKALAQFKAQLKAPFSFVSDEKVELTKVYDVKMPVMSLAQRYTFVIGEGRKILKVESGSDAIDPSGAVESCPLHGHKH